MSIIEKLQQRWHGKHYPFLVHPNGSLYFDELAKQDTPDLSMVKSGDVVALIGDFDPSSIATLLILISKNVIIVPLSKATKTQHEYFFKTALVDIVIENSDVKRIDQGKTNNLIDKLRKKNHAGLILFSSGTTGRPKAILHDFTIFLQRFETARPTLRTVNFLLFDHIGGLNTLLHTLFNKGTVIALSSRDVGEVLRICEEQKVEVLPTTPTFLRMMLLSGLIKNKFPKSIKLITYGTERMDQPTLNALCAALPKVDFRQTFGMSELGIVRVKSEARDSLFMKIGGEGVQTKVVNGILKIRSQTRMMGYLNADSPFDDEGWYNTHDLVEEKNGYYKVIGRTSEVINIGGLKFMPSEIERVVLQFEGVELAKVEAKPNPITGQHIELTVQPLRNTLIDKCELKKFLSNSLPRHMVPQKLKISEVLVGHRFKKF